ncbi:MAG TPA: carboxypeptidase-like regulatory domain-containing protein [Candidatus Angelobacter sp.]|nr:carboxypeptidase-like regulatory domain-containing protein [Candidatus Angelobacter sp.]
MDARALPILENVHVAALCPSDWERMVGDSRVRHCAECSLNVYNLSEMTRREAERLIRSHEGRLCVRFYRRADGTILTQNCPRGLKAAIRRVSRIAGAVFTAAMSLGTVFSPAAAKSTAQTQNDPASTGIDFTVVDPSGSVIPNAKVLLCQCKGRATTSVSTDSIGVAHFLGLAEGDYQAEVQAPGFKSKRQDVKIQARKVGHLQLKLQVAPTSTTVEVVATPVAVQGTMGMVTVTNTGVPWPPAGSGGRPELMRR